MLYSAPGPAITPEAHTETFPMFLLPRLLHLPVSPQPLGLGGGGGGPDPVRDVWCFRLFPFNGLNEYTILLHTVGSRTRAFIQVDNELKYLVDGVAIHMNEGTVPLELLPGLAYHCAQHHEEHPPLHPEELNLRPCPHQRQRLDLRDCDREQGGLLDPRTCIRLLHHSPSVPPPGSCTLDVCYSKSSTQEQSCVDVFMDTLPQEACVPQYMVRDLLHAGKPSTLPRLDTQVHIMHVHETKKETDLPMLVLHLHQYAQDMDVERLPPRPCPSPPDNWTPSFKSNIPWPSMMASRTPPPRPPQPEHHCWNMSGEGPEPGLTCHFRPLWLPTKIIKTGETEIRYGDIVDDKGVPSKNYIVFDPPHLDFKEHPTGMPLMRKVVVQNSSPENSVQLHSLSGNTLHFHCTFFQDKVVLPGGNTSFDVVFLGREEGLIENTIFIHTSIGTYKYGVRAVGTGNPYRLRPLVGVRMPLNSSYSPLIQLHNPHPHSLQITEMYSTGGDLHLELLSGTQEGQKNVWNIPPYHTRALMRANFVARRENNHTAYVRIVTSETDSDYLVVPVEVEVSGQPGLFCPHDGLHFGLRTPHDPPSSLPLHLLNSAHKHIHIQNVITTPVNDAITIDFKPMKIPPGTVRPTQVATVTFDPSKVTSGKKISGKILIKSKVSAYKLSVPYTVDLLQGALLYNTSITKFYTGADIGSSEAQSGVSFGTVAGVVAAAGGGVGGGGGTSNPSSEPRNLTLTNTFPCPVVIYNLTLPDEAKKHFEIGWDGPVVVQEGQSAHVATLQLLSVGTDARLSTAITVHTNITTIKIPLRAYNGKLTKYIPPVGGDSWLDFGTLGMGDHRDIYFYVINENPVELRLRGWGSNLTRSAVELMGVEEGNVTTIKNRNNMTYASKSLFLKPNHYAAFRIGVLTPDTEGIFIAESFVQTQFEQIKIPFRLRTADGSLSVVPNTLIFINAFPGKISHQNLHILSTFGHPMTVKEVKPLPSDTRFSYEPSQSSPSTLQPGHKSHIGRLVFDPKVECGTECYTGFPLSGKAGQQWVNTLSLTSHVADTDTNLYSTLRSRYLNLSAAIFNTSIVLHTSEVHGFHFTAQAALNWPVLCYPQHLTFPLTQVLNTSIHDVFVENPASVPVVAQILLLHHYPATQQLLSIIHHQLPNGHTLLNEEGSGGGNSNDVFTLVDADSVGGGGTRGGTMPPPAPEITSGLAQHRRTLEEQFKTRVAKDSIAIILEPGVKVKVRLSFTPPDEKLHSTVLLVRNNLTVIDAMLVQGRGGRGFLKFGNRKPGSPMPLAFNIGAKHLKDCDNARSSKYYQPNFTVKRSFMARNTGELPVQVWGFNINDLPCEGYGFKVLNCEGFQLAPNGSHKVDIAFTPDFTLSKIQQRLIIHTSLGLIGGLDEGMVLVTKDEPGRVEYSLVATVPTQLLAECGAAVPRPTWEPLLYYAVLPLMVAMLVGAVILSALEADHILKTTIIAMTTSLPANGHTPGFDKSKVFDLRTITHIDSKNMSVKNGYANGHAHIENIKNNSPLNTNTNNKKSSSMSPLGEVMTNGRKPCSGANSKKIGNNQITNSSTKPKYLKQSDNKSCQSVADTFSGISDNPATQNQSKNSKGKGNNAKGNNRSLESMSWARFFQRAVGKKEDSNTETSDSSNGKKFLNSNNRDDSSVLKQSVGTETDLHIVETYPKLRRRMKQSNEEETSSTTTESSNTDDLSISERDTPISKSSDMTSSSQSGKTSKKRSGKSKNSISKSPNSQGSRSSSNQNEDNSGFEISTKVKGLKRCKDPSGRNFGGDIFQPNTLELPYTLKPLRNRESDREKDSQKTPRANIIKSTDSIESVGSGRSSPTPNWEEARQTSTDSLSDLPTPTFTATHPKPQSQPQPLAPRESSYSAILLGTDKQKAKVTPFAKVPPEVKMVDKPLGVIGQKVNNTNNNNMGTQRGAPSPATSVAVSSMSSSPLFTISDNNFSHRPKEDPYSRSLYSNYVECGSLTASQTGNSIHSWDPKTLTAPTLRPPPGLTQSHDTPHRHSSLSEDEWPRYCHSQVGGSLWPDGSGYHHDGISLNSGNAPAPSLWDSLSNIWSPPFWSSNQGSSPQSTPPSPWGTTLSQAPVNDASGAVSKGLGFDPFCSVGNIWSAPTGHATGDLWAPPTSKKDV
ncbi:transmembrane protein 131-like isoform X2 [Homarus americanus]|uniref:transmembrane protein 131-like isoform X2 n=1 Tax=Homarus americanus TaxID=6706 RepID=UPI001C4570BF|nr:transmembrane protein 131-like isoform X2 [Homarus americanus]